MQATRENTEVVLVRHANRAVYGVRGGSDECSGLAGTRFGHGGGEQPGKAFASTKRRFRSYSASHHVFGHHTELLLYRLKLAQRLAELHALVAVIQRH